MITSMLLAAEGLAQLGCGIGAGIAVIGAGNNQKNKSHIISVLCFVFLRARKVTKKNSIIIRWHISMCLIFRSK